MGETEEEDNDPGALSGVKYPCMPSLVALQQMRNRLHLAHLGKKLMKWSALASGREMRRVASQILVAYDGFEEECANANMLLARCRFYLPEINKIVLEDIQKGAALTVSTTITTSGGVKMKVFTVEEKEPAPQAYPHLGLGLGGQLIKETKLAWAALLKKFTLILELREAFENLDFSFKNSTKKENVLGKIIIPRLNVTIHYILQELEELQREELFRIKKVVQYKTRAKDKKKEKSKVPEEKPLPLPIIEPPALKKLSFESPEKEPSLTETTCRLPAEESTPEPPEGKCTPKKPSEIEVPKKVTLPPTSPTPKLPVCQKSLRPKLCIGAEIPECCTGCIKELEIEPKFEISKTEPSPTSEFIKIEFIQKKLDDILKLSKGLINSGHVHYNAFSRCCEDLRNEFSRLNKKEDVKDTDTLRKLASHIRYLIENTKKIQSNSIKPTTSLQSFMNTLIEAKHKLHNFITRTELVTTRDNLDAIWQCIDEFKLMTSSHTSNDSKIQTSASASRDDENLINNITKNKESTSTEQFLDACADFKTKICKFKGKPPKANSELSELVEQLNEAITLSSVAKENGLIGQNVDKFIASCENLKKYLLKSDDISETFETFLDSCKTTEEHIEKSISYIQPSHSHSAKVNTSEELHRKIIDYIRGTDSLEFVNAPKTTAIGKKRTRVARKTSKIKPNKEEPKGKDSDEKLKGGKDSLSSSSSLKGSNKSSFSNDERIVFSTDVNDTPDKDDLGAFDNKVKTIVKIKRVINEDGTITEHVDTLTIKVDKHDPDDFSLGVDPNLSDYDASITSSEKSSPSPSSSNRNKNPKDSYKESKDNSKDIRHCAIPNQLNFPFVNPNRKVNSEICFAVARRTPVLRNSMSEITFNKPNFSLALTPF